MKITRAYLNVTNGKPRRELNILLSEKEQNGVHAVYIDAISPYNLDMEFGAGIEIELTDVKSWMADYRHSEFWCKPQFGNEVLDIPNETQGLIYEKNDGTYGVILPVVSEEYKCVLSSVEREEGEEIEKVDNVILAKLFSWLEGISDIKALAYLWAEGENPYELMEKCAKSGLELLGTGYRIRQERRYPEIFEYLGWCSWDAFGIHVDEESLLKKCEEFKEKEIPVRWAILDDMWAEVRDFYGRTYSDRKEMLSLMNSSKLYSFEADPIRFPNGLEHCIDQMKEYGMKIGIWHPTTGYWRGIDPKGPIFQELKDCLLHTERGSYVPSPEKEKSYRFYSAFHDYLRKCGAELIKIDNQSMSRRFYKNHGPVGKVARDFHDAMEASVGAHFDNQMINCMGMANEDMWNRSVSPISRCSDDFLPENVPWFAKHIMQCSYNCLVQGQFYYCDWDMWWTDDSQAVKNSILRAISGGPIYVSDTLDRSRAEVLKPLIFSDGRILRCEKPAVPARDSLTVSPLTSGRAFKLQNTVNGCGMLAVFNLDEEEKPVAGMISPKDVEGLVGEEFAVYEHFSKEFRILTAEESFELQLENANDYRLYVIVPLTNGSGVIGRTDKFISPASYTYRKDGQVELIESGPWAYVEDYKLVIRE